MDADTLFSRLRKDASQIPVDPLHLGAAIDRAQRRIAWRLIALPVATGILFGLLVVGGLGARGVVHPGDVVRDIRPPTPPRDLSAEAVGPEEVVLSWSAARDNVAVAGYSVYRNGKEIARVDGTTLAFSDEGARPDTEYRYWVDAFDSAGNHSKRSQPASVTTPGLQDVRAPSVPKDLRAEVVGPNEVALTWSPSTDDNAVVGYTIYRDGEEITTVDGLTVTYSDVDLLPDTAYTYAVDAFDESGNHSDPSDEVMVTTPLPLDSEPPAAPARVFVRSVEEGLQIQWSPSTDNVGVAGYRILRNGKEIGSVDGATTSFLDTSDLCEGTYLYEVIAFDAAGNESEPGSDEITIVC